MSGKQFFTTELLLLTAADLHQMLEDIQNSRLDIQFRGFVYAALEKINEGYHVFYEGDVD